MPLSDVSPSSCPWVWHFKNIVWDGFCISLLSPLPLSLCVCVPVCQSFCFCMCVCVLWLLTPLSIAFHSTGAWGRQGVTWQWPQGCFLTVPLKGQWGHSHSVCGILERLLRPWKISLWPPGSLYFAESSSWVWQQAPFPFILFLPYDQDYMGYSRAPACSWF